MKSNNILKVSCAFIAATMEGPDYVCVCCNRLMYHKTVQVFINSKYPKAPKEFDVFSVMDKQWICKTCDCALRRGKLPAQAKANNLMLDNVPEQLSDLK